MKRCTKCKKLQFLSCFHKNSDGKNGLRSTCKNCCKKYRNKYYFKNKHRQEQQVFMWQQENPEKIKKYVEKYKASKKGKKLDAKCKAKRKRNLGWILMFPNPFAEDVFVDYHHITDVYVVAIPRELHKLYCGKYHREKVMGIVKQIYLEKGDY